MDDRNDSFNPAENNENINESQQPQQEQNPITNENNIENEGYTFYSERPEQEAETNYTAYSPEPTVYPAAVKPVKEKKYVSLPAGILALIIAATVFLSGVASVIVSYAINKNSTGNVIVSNDGSGYSYSINTSSESTNIEAIATAVTPCVVCIQVTYNQQSGSFFNYYYGDNNSGQTTSQGSGVIYSADGYIITNYHVIKNAVQSSGKISVYLDSDQNTPIDATVVGYDSTYDLAVIKINKTNLPYITIGSAEDITVGEQVAVVGCPYSKEFMGSVTVGYISGKDRKFSSDNGNITLLQTDAAINPGNSGGALVNNKGELIGIPSAKIADGVNYEGMGFAIPIDRVMQTCKAIINNNNNTASSNSSSGSAYIGVYINTQYESVYSQYNMPQGAYVAIVTSGSPADNAGVKAGDVITAINNVAVTGYDSLTAQLSKYKPGDKLSVTIYRNGSTANVTITAGSNNN